MANDNLANQLPEKIRRRLTPVGVHKGPEDPAAVSTTMTTAAKEETHRALRQKAARECERVRLVHSKVRENEAQKRRQVLENRNSRLQEAQARRESVIQKRRSSAQSFVAMIRESQQEMSSEQSVEDEVPDEKQPPGKSDLSTMSTNQQNQTDSTRSPVTTATTSSEGEPININNNDKSGGGAGSSSSDPSASTASERSSVSKHGHSYLASVIQIQKDIERLRELSPLVQYLILDSPIPSTAPSDPPDTNDFPDHVVKYIKSLHPLESQDRKAFTMLLLRELKGDGIRSIRSPATKLSTLLVHFGIPSTAASGHVMLMALTQMLKIAPSEFQQPWEDAVSLVSSFRRALASVTSETQVPTWFASIFVRHYEASSKYSDRMESRINRVMLNQLAEQVSLVPLLAQEVVQYGGREGVLREIGVDRFNKAFQRLTTCVCPRNVIHSPETMRQARRFASRALYVACRSAPHNLTHDTYTTHMRQLEMWVKDPSWDSISDDLSTNLSLQMKRSRRMSDEFAAAAFYSQFYELFRVFCIPSESSSAFGISAQEIQGIVFSSGDCEHMLKWVGQYVCATDAVLDNINEDEECFPRDLIKEQGMQAPFFTPHCRIDLEMLIMTRMKVDRVVESMHKYETEKLYFKGYSPMGDATLRFAYELGALFERFRLCKKTVTSVQWKYWYLVFLTRAICDIVPTRDNYHVKLFDYLMVELESQITNHMFADNHSDVENGSDYGGSRDSFCSRVILDKLLNCVEQFGSLHRATEIKTVTGKFRRLQLVTGGSTSSAPTGPDSDQWFDECVSVNLHVDLYLLVSQMLYDMRIGENLNAAIRGSYSSILQEEMDTFGKQCRAGYDGLKNTSEFLKTAFDHAITKLHPGDVRNESSCSFHDPLLIGFCNLVFGSPQLDLPYGYGLPESMFSIYRFIVACQIETRALIICGSILLHAQNTVHVSGYRMKPSQADVMVLRTGRMPKSSTLKTPTLFEAVLELVFDHPHFGEEEAESVAHTIAQHVEMPTLGEDGRMRVYSQLVDRIKASTARVVHQNGSDSVGKVLTKRVEGHFLYSHARLKNMDPPASVETIAGFDSAVEHLTERMGTVWKTHYESHAHGYLDMVHHLRPDLKPAVITRLRFKTVGPKERRVRPHFR
ncbi:hypothetical protein B0I72DRAFT_135900 [Yarrowia lipolytica]|jgi:hypothetical protein|nr:hypothetical protein B0I72DRAFT_135900 [Yarrowia lipolytica]RDW40444.1 hypothetical protein B0I73DRAFT_130367 [Yarrowia lipolytica]RDW48715.1 hypothetical protein B0I74DRAFT_133173 [Yarrowia lipolytica]RDW54178.1 hypothetical protein B0I75DRAFT_135144 [Yarrowia lipolytica]